MRGIIFLLISTTFSYSQNDSILVTVKYDNPNLKVRILEVQLLKKVVSIYNNKARVPLKLNFELITSRNGVFNSIMSKENEKKLFCGLTSATIEKENRFEFSYPHIPIQDVLIANQSQKELNKRSTFKVAFLDIPYYKNIIDSLSKIYHLKGLAMNDYEDVVASIDNGKADFYLGDSVDSWEHPEKKIALKLNKKVAYLGFIYPNHSGLKAKFDPILKYLTRSPYFFDLLKYTFGANVVQDYKEVIYTHN